MQISGIGNYLEKTWNVTDFWYHGKRYAKTTEGGWIEIK